MGAWGTGLYSDDTTCEVRDAFKTHLEEGLSHSEVESEILGRFDEVLSNHQIECLVYFGLAETQWRFGCLSANVKAHTLALLKAGGDVRYWQEDAPSEVRARAKVLAALSSKLQTPQPPLRQVKLKPQKPPKKQLDSPIGAVFSIPLPLGNIALLKFVGLRPAGKRDEAVFRLLPWIGDTLPESSILDRIADQAVTVCEHHEFSFFLNDRRKNPIHHLQPTDIVLTTTIPPDYSRYVSINMESFAAKAQHSLELTPWKNC
ncbi:hypothetical protein [Paraherbaspirillum soli]|uniref:DUF4259 domain-containing protein n=1 Tax=Paraherbaspirillum soli TaxID=631222 RepID=A0ABW0MGQ6_9BURK